MKIFISWSKERSRKVAAGLAELIQAVIPGAEPWVSARIRGGEHWPRQLNAQLNAADFGIVCLTDDTQEQKWIFYEMGVLISRGVEVCPYLIDMHMRTQELPLPLPEMQARRADDKETLGLLLDIKERVGELDPRDERELAAAFVEHWPKFDKALQRARLKTAQEALKYCEQRVENMLDVGKKLEANRVFLSTALKDVIREAVELYDSRRGEFRIKPVEQDPVYQEVLVEISDHAYGVIESVRSYFPEPSIVVEQVRNFLEANYGRPELMVSLNKLAPFLHLDTPASQKQERLEYEVELELCQVFFGFHHTLAKKLLDSVKE